MIHITIGIPMADTATLPAMIDSAKPASKPFDIDPIKKAELLEKLKTDLLYQQTFLQEKSKLSFKYFCREVLGYKDMIGKQAELLPGYSHDDLCDFIQHDPTAFKLMLMPRFTFKSYISTVAFSLWKLLCDPDHRILICSDTNEKAEGFLSGIKNHIEGKIAGSKFRAICGPWEVDAKRGVWNQQAIVIRPRKNAQIDPSVDTAGIETSKTGKHYDTIIFDDLVSEKNITTPELMQKVKDVYKKYLSVLKPGGNLLMIGTRWHFGDLYGMLIAEEEDRARLGHPKVFAISIRSAEVDGVYPYSRMGPSSLTQERLALLKTQQGSYLYSALYLNNPTDDENAKFKVSDFSFYPDHHRNDPKFLAQLFITCCLDPIPPHDTMKGDDAAFTVVGTDEDWNLYILDIVAGRLQPNEQINELFNLRSRWNFQAFGVEDNHWQKTLLPEIEARIAVERRDNPHFRMFHVEGFTRGSSNSKHKDIFGLQPYHERKAIKFPGTRIELLTGAYQKLAMQMQQYPNSAHDDVLDSLSMHLGIRRPGSKLIVPKDAPFSSAIWFEQEQRKRQIKEMKFIPRWQRRPLAPLSFS